MYLYQFPEIDVMQCNLKPLKWSLPSNLKAFLKLIKMKHLFKNAFLGGLFLLASCASDKDGDKIHDKKDKCPDTPKGIKVDATGCPEEEKDAKETIGAINFYLENSASMGGYLKGNTEFKNIVTDLVVLLDGTEADKG